MVNRPHPPKNDLTLFVHGIAEELITSAAAVLDDLRSRRRHSQRAGSLYAGAAGIALFLHELAASRRVTATTAEGEREPLSYRALLQGARVFCDHAEELLAGDAGVLDAERPDYALTISQGRGGVGYVRTLVASCLGDADGVASGIALLQDAWTELEDSQGRRAPRTELLDGAAGFACAARDLLARCDMPRDLETRLRDLLEKTHEVLRSSVGERPLKDRAAAKVCVAHGIAGELLAMLLVRGDRDRELVCRRLDELANMARRERGFIVWPAVIGENELSPLLFSWCNGVAGMTQVWCRAYEVFADPRYLGLAKESAQTTFGLLCPGVTLCCGTAGQAVVLDLYSRISKDTSFRRRALDRLRQAIAGSAGLGPGVLQGKAGVAMAVLRVGEVRAAARGLAVFDAS